MGSLDQRFPYMTPFTKVLAFLSLLGALVSSALFVSTWFAEGIIIEKAKGHALETIQPRLETVIKFLENPKLVGNLPPSVEEKLRGELVDYRSDPERWLLKIAEKSGENAADFQSPEIKSPLARKGVDLLASRDCPDTSGKAMRISSSIFASSAARMPSHYRSPPGCSSSRGRRRCGSGSGHGRPF
jgi:hypothetical protein